MRLILHLDMDAFYAAVEERDNPQFRGKPVVVGADPKEGRGRGVVSTANYEARKYGIRSAMPISWAYRVNPNAIFLPVDMKRYVAVSEKIMPILKRYSEKMEQVSIDEAYLELRTDNIHQAAEVAKEIKKEIWKKEKLTCSIGIGPNKLIAKIASDYKKPNGLTVVQPEEMQSFLDPKPANVIPGVGPVTYAKLREIGVETIGDLRKITKEKMGMMFGVNGEYIWHMAKGQDTRPVVEEREIKSVGRQTTFLYDVRESGVIVDVAVKLLEEIFEELQEKGFVGKTLTVMVRYSGFETHTSQKSIDEPLTLEKAKKLAIKLLLPYLGKRPVRLIGVRISNFRFQGLHLS